MSDSLTEISKQYPGGIEEAQRRALSAKYAYEHNQRALAIKLMPLVYACLLVGKENARTREEIDIILSCQCPFKYDEWNLKDALSFLRSDPKFYHVRNDYKLGYYLGRKNEGY